MGGKAGSMTTLNTGPGRGMWGSTPQNPMMFQDMTATLAAKPTWKSRFPKRDGHLPDVFPPVSTSRRMTSPMGNRSRSCSTHCLRKITTRQAPMKSSVPRADIHQKSGMTQSCHGIGNPAGRPSKKSETCPLSLGMTAHSGRYAKKWASHWFSGLAK